MEVTKSGGGQGAGEGLGFWNQQLDSHHGFIFNELDELKSFIKLF